MACYHPIPAYQSGPGARPRLWAPDAWANLQLPCGQCIGCQSDRATKWALRCSHESSRFRNNTFLTLTYDDDHLPPKGHLEPRDLQLFIKRLRKRAGADLKHATNSGRILDTDHRSGIRYFACGEYGTRNQRPHYHALLFNTAFPDKRKVGKDAYEADILNELWPNGKHQFGEATPAGASYIAQYTLNKQQKGVWRERPEPFLRMSLKPAIGAEWLKRYKRDLAYGYIVEDGRKHAIPRYYKKLLLREDPEFLEAIETKIQAHSLIPSDHSDPDRLKDSETIHQRRKQLTEARKL